MKEGAINCPGEKTREGVMRTGRGAAEDEEVIGAGGGAARGAAGVAREVNWSLWGSSPAVK